MMNHSEDVSKIEAMLFKGKRLAFRHCASEAGKDFSSTTFLLIRRLAEYYKSNNRPITTSEIADIMHVSLSAVTQLLNPLEKGGIVKRQKTGEDRRATYITLTLKGKMLVNHIHKHRDHDNMLGKLLDYLGPDDSKELVRLAGKIDGFIDEQLKKKEKVKSEG